MTKVFGIGLSRTGTASLAEALRILGLTCSHWPMSMAEIHEHQAVTDITVSCRFRELDARYPGARFILTVRDLESWSRSCFYHYRHEINYNDLVEPFRTFTLQAESIYGEGGGRRQTLRGFVLAYRRHLKEVCEYFSERPQDFLVLDISAGEGWKELCTFLGKPEPAVPFPHKNRRPMA